MPRAEHEKYIRIAIETARHAGNDVPVGAVLVRDGEIIAKAHNRKEADNDPSAHAEILVMREACQKLGTWRLDNTVLYVTLEPCPMCAAAILYARVSEVVFGARDPLYGAFGSALNLSDYLGFRPRIVEGVLEEKCSELLKSFFEGKR